MTKHQVPSNFEAEGALLGSILLNPTIVYDIATFLRAEDFYLVKHGWVYEAVLELADKGKPVDFLTITDELEKKGRLDEVGGPVWVSQLMDNVPSSLHAEAYAHMIEDTSYRRRLLQAAGEIAKLAYDEDKDLIEVLQGAEQEIFEVADRRIENDVVSISDAVRQARDQAEAAIKTGGMTGISTGLADLDRVLGGLQKEDLVIIAGRPGMGKTGLGMGIAHYAAQKSRKKVAVFSVEMPAPQIAMRMIVAEHERTPALNKPKLSTHDVRNGRLDQKQWEWFVKAAAQFDNTPIYIDDTPDLTPQALRSKCRRIRATHGLDLIIVDYLQLMETGLRPDSRVQEITYISRWLKKLAREMRVPVLAMAQLSRSPEQRTNKRPMLSDLRESGAIEQDADVVIFLYRDDYYDENSDKENVAELNVAKQRNGPQETIEAYFDKESTLFKDLAYRTFSPNGRDQ